jgi:gas vesicle protein
MINKLFGRASWERKRARRQKAIMFSVLLGAAVAMGSGVAIGIFCASKFGKEERSKMMDKVFNTAEGIKARVHHKAETLRNTADAAADKAGMVMEEVHGKSEEVKKDLHDGGLEIKKDIYETTDNILKELKSEEQ